MHFSPGLLGCLQLAEFYLVSQICPLCHCLTRSARSFRIDGFHSKGSRASLGKLRFATNLNVYIMKLKSLVLQKSPLLNRALRPPQSGVLLAQQHCFAFTTRLTIIASRR